MFQLHINVSVYSDLFKIVDYTGLYVLPVTPMGVYERERELSCCYVRECVQQNGDED